MRPPRLFVAALVVVCVTSCAGLQPVVQPVINVGKSCADKALHDAALGILNDVASALVCDGGNLAALPACVETGLAAVAKTTSWDAVWCAVDWVENNAAANAAASNDGLEALKRLRAANWKTAHGPGPASAPPPTAVDAITPAQTTIGMMLRNRVRI